MEEKLDKTIQKEAGAMESQNKFGIGGVPVKVAAKVMGIHQETLRNKMEDGTLDLGLIYKAKKKRGKRPYRNTYISPQKFYELTGYIWEGEKDLPE